MDTLQNPPKTVSGQGGEEAVTQPTASVQTPISGPHKEMSPVVTEAPVQEYVAPSSPQEIEPVLPPEVKEAGVEAVTNNEFPKLSEEDRKAGIAPAPEATPVTDVSQQHSVQLPSPLQVEQTIKTTTVQDSAHWHATLLKYLLARLGVKK